MLQDLIKFLAITDFYPSPVIAPRSDQQLKMKENNGHSELSTFDMAGSGLGIYMVFKAYSPERRYLHFTMLKLSLEEAE